MSLAYEVTKFTFCKLTTWPDKKVWGSIGLLKTSPKETEVVIIAFVLDIIDHKEYDRKFGYKS